MKSATRGSPVHLPGVGATAPLAHTPVLRELIGAACDVRGDAEQAVRLARWLGPLLPRLGAGHSGEVFEALATTAAIDLTAARVLEAHLDALTILEQAALNPEVLFPGTPAEQQSWGVFAAEAPGQRLDAVQQRDGTWCLDGTKPWCSLAGGLTQALVTAHTFGEHRRLFAVDLVDPGVVVRAADWVALGLPQVASGPVEFTHVDAVPIGIDEWYLTRSGFAWGGIGVAACWYGGAVGVARLLAGALHERDPDQLALAQLGAVDVLLSACATTLTGAADAIDTGRATGHAGTLLAARVRGLVARTVDDVLLRVAHTLGPAPLAFNARHTQRVADLQLYVRQHHAEYDDAALGRQLLATGRRNRPSTDTADAPQGGEMPW